MDAVVVTGAGSGIGRNIAVEMGRANLHVLCISKSERALRTAKEIMEDGGSADGLELNLSKYLTVESVIKEWISGKSFQRLGVVLAGGVLGPSGALEQSSLAEWEESWRVNVLGNLAVLKGLLPTMIQNKFGRIVTFAGGGAAYSYPLFPAYAASKVAMVRITENLHEDLKSKGDFACVCLAPGANETEMLNKVRAAGGEVRTVVAISEPVNFVNSFLSSRTVSFSGCYVHVRDNWAEYIDTKSTLGKDKWKLRRTE